MDTPRTHGHTHTHTHTHTHRWMKRRTDGLMDGYTLLQRCEDTSKNDIMAYNYIYILKSNNYLYDEFNLRNLIILTPNLNCPQQDHSNDMLH